MTRAIIKNVCYSFDHEFFQVGQAYRIKDYREVPITEKTALLSCITDDSIEFIECKGDTRTFKLKDLILGDVDIQKLTNGEDMEISDVETCVSNSNDE